MEVRLSALSAGHALLQKDPLVLISVRGSANPRDMVQLEGLGKLKKFSDSTGAQNAAF
jgi:hypothetical protein